jgi:hypothetical protein
LRDPRAAQSDGFGQSAGISGNAIVIGAPGTAVGANQGQGAAYVFNKPASGWKNSMNASQLVASDGTANASFGLSSAISGATIVAGAIGSNNSPGTAYVFGP